MRSTLLLGAVLLAGRADAAAPTRAEAEAVLARLAEAYAAEDLAAVEALHDEPLRRTVRNHVGRLFQGRNYFTLVDRIVEEAPREGGGLDVTVVSVLRSRPVTATEDVREKNRWLYGFARGSDGVVRIVSSVPAPRDAPPAEPPWRPEDWTGRVALEPRPGRLGTPEGRVEVDLAVLLRNASQAPQSSVAWVMHPHVVELEARVGDVALDPERDEGIVDAWRADLPEPIGPGGTVTLRFVHVVDVVGSSVHSRVGMDGGHLFTDGGWHPVFGPSHADFPLRASHDLTIEVPAGAVAVAPGVLAQRSDPPGGPATFRWFSRHPGAELGIVFGPLVHEEIPLAGGVVLDSWRRPAAAGETVARLAEIMRGFLEHAQGILGPSPADRVTVVEQQGDVFRAAPAFFALREPQGTARGLDSRRRDPMHLFVTHHLAHLWFVDACRPVGPGAIVLTESLSDHLALDFLGSGVDEALPSQRRGERMEVASERPDLDRPLAEAVHGMEQLDVFGFGKGLVVLDTYREFAGRERWRAALASYWQQARGRDVPLGALLEALGGDDPRLQEFCTAWFFGKGFADVSVADVRSRPGADGRVSAEIDIRNRGVGPVPLELVVVAAGRSHDAALDVGASGVTTLTLDLPGPPRGVQLDPRRLIWQDNSVNDVWPALVGERHPEARPDPRIDRRTLDALDRKTRRP